MINDNTKLNVINKHIDHLTGFKLDLNVNSCQLSYEVAEDVGYRDYVNLTSVLTSTALPLWLDMREGGASRWRLL